MDVVRCLRPPLRLLARPLSRRPAGLSVRRCLSTTAVRLGIPTRALVYSKHGDPQKVLQLHVYNIPDSIPPDSVLVQTLAAPINPADVNTIQGTYGSKQPKTTDLGTKEPSAVPGNEGVFAVRKIGENVFDLAPGDWVIPAVAQIGTWRTYAVFKARDLLKVNNRGLSPKQISRVGVNPCTAYRLLKSYGPTTGPGTDLGMRPLEPGSGKWFIQNGANSAVGRAVIQLGKLWGLRSINIIRNRQTSEETDMLAQELLFLGADVVVPQDDFFSSEWKADLNRITDQGTENIGLGLDCVGGQSATIMARSLGEGGSLVTYGSMGRLPLSLPVGLLIFKDIRSVGFWLTRWNEQDPEGREEMIDHVITLMSQDKLDNLPEDVVEWNWESDLIDLRKAVGSAMEGFKIGKPVFVFPAPENEGSSATSIKNSAAPPPTAFGWT